ncbi:MAG: acetylpolyamine amidohydrolase [Bacteroidetes bacterium CG18_big_fil_WC_8_21_14_2_50_41_14]|nr:MAG: acetylpolyamine amidohydrolase [Bacteroidetes bacterium CG18_big_fil_WC_8_21_14_2_50_41_14]
MFRIRKISNPHLSVNIQTMTKIKEIISQQFPDINPKKIDEISAQLTDSLKYKYQAKIFVAEDEKSSIRGFALFLYMPDLQFCYLDYIAVSPGKTSGGIGGALYERVREEAEAFGALGIFFECLPDDPNLCKDQTNLTQNKKRLAFYERYGARPIVNTRYETTVVPEDDCPPYLVFDGLGVRETLPVAVTRQIFRAILERKYGDYCPETYIKEVVGSVIEDPVQLRPFKYKKKILPELFRTGLPEKKKIFWVINDKHAIHHIREIGYVESPVRIKSIEKELLKTGLFRLGKVKEFSEKPILKIHDPGYVNFFKNVCKSLPPGKSVYPYVFPIRNAARPPKELSVRAGYYCFDTFTPLNKNAYLAARWGVNSALTAAEEMLEGCNLAYVLTRPPGHHAERNVFGGFCYFNNNAIVADYLSLFGNVAILDIDYHHGNGQQQIFYGRKDVFTISIHGHPSFAYPYFSGFNDETGAGEGRGYNLNFPLPETLDGAGYRVTLSKALSAIQKYKPEYLVIALGLDTAKDDPTGTWTLAAKDFEENGRMIGKLKIPTLVVQEGGYKNRSLGMNAKSFFNGLYQGHSK